MVPGITKWSTTDFEPVSLPRVRNMLHGERRSISLTSAHIDKNLRTTILYDIQNQTEEGCRFIRGRRVLVTATKITWADNESDGRFRLAVSDKLLNYNVKEINTSSKCYRFKLGIFIR